MVFDPSFKWTISASNQHSNAGFTLYEGREVTGKPVLTMQRGEVILQDGEIVAQPGQGRFISMDTSHLYR